MSGHVIRRLFSSGAFFVLAAACLALTGCSGQATVHGTVAYAGEPLKGGYVTFVPEATGPTYTTSINPDGTYSVANVKTGKYKVCVDTEGLKGGEITPTTGYTGSSKGGKGPAAAPGSKGPSGGADLQKLAESGKLKNAPPPGAQVPEGYKDGFATQKENASKYVAIPLKYAKPESTELTVEVKAGEQEHNITLQK